MRQKPIAVDSKTYGNCNMEFSGFCFNSVNANFRWLMLFALDLEFYSKNFFGYVDVRYGVESKFGNLDFGASFRDCHVRDEYVAKVSVYWSVGSDFRQQLFRCLLTYGFGGFTAFPDVVGSRTLPSENLATIVMPLPG